MKSSSATKTFRSCIVLLACSFIRLLYEGLWSSIGIFFVAWETQFDVSPSTLAWIGVSLIPVSLLIGPLSSALALKLSNRVVVMIGGTLTCAALVGISLATEIWQITLIMIFCGLGLGLVYIPGCSFYVCYFQRHFGFANGVNASFSSLGTLIAPPLVDLLVDEYGWRDALLFLSAVMANLCVCGGLMVPPNFKQVRKPNVEGATWTSKPDTSSTLLSSDENQFSNKNYPNNGNIVENPQTNGTMTNIACSEYDFVNKTSKFSDNFQTSGTLIPDGRCKCLRSMYEVLDLSLFRNVRFLFNSLLTPFLYAFIYPPIIYFVPLCVEAGISTLKASLVMTCIGVFAVLARLSPIGWMVDKGIISASKTGGLAAIIGGLAISILPLAKSYTVFVTIGCIVGLFPVGTAGSLYVYVVKDSAGLTEKVPGAVAWSLLSVGIGAVPCILLSGFLYDVTKNYVAPLAISGVGLMCMGITMLSDPFLIKWQNEIDARRNKDARTAENMRLK